MNPAQDSPDANEPGRHLPVLLQPLLEHAAVFPADAPLRIWDGTLGLAGHLTALADKFPNATLYGSDQDALMLQKARENMERLEFAERFTSQKANFSENPFGQSAPFDIILLDLGISSLHVDTFERGMSYRRDEPLDMRLDTQTGIPVGQWLMKARREEIINILRTYGEERRAGQIARMIFERVQTGEAITSGELARICERAYPPAQRYASKRHSAARTFQALRIFINREIEHLERALEFLPGLLTQGGRLFMISFHSLEDRAVKRKFRSLEKIAVNDPMAKSAFLDGDYRSVVKKPIAPDEAESTQNPRARSAKLRILERLK